MFGLYPLRNTMIDLFSQCHRLNCILHGYQSISDISIHSSIYGNLEATNHWMIQWWIHLKEGGSFHRKGTLLDYLNLIKDKRIHKANHPRRSEVLFTTINDRLKEVEGSKPG